MIKFSVILITLLLLIHILRRYLRNKILNTVVRYKTQKGIEILGYVLLTFLAITYFREPLKILLLSLVYHSPTASHDDRIGLPMVAVKKHYLENGMTKEQFTNDIQNWINNPTKDTAKMHGAVKCFGVMPKQIFPEETIKQISEYMFDYDIE